MAKIPIFAHFFHCFRVLFERPSPFRALDTIATDRKIAEKSINCPQYFISRFPETLKLTKYKSWKRTMGLQTGYFKNAAEVYLSEMTRHAPVTLLVALTGFMRYFICRVVLKKLTSSTSVSYYFTILSYISIKFSDNVLS